MSSPYGPSGGQQDPNAPWGQQPYGAGGPPGTPSGGFPAQGGGYPQQQPYGQQPDPGQHPQRQHPQQPYGHQPDPSHQQQPYGQQPDQGQQHPYGAQPDQSQQPYGYGQQQQQQYPQTGGVPAYGGGEQAQQFGSYQPQGYPGQQQPAKKKGGAGLWIGVVVAVLIVAAVGVLGFITPGWFTKKVFDQTALQDGVKSILTGNYNVEKLDSVVCPSGEEVKKDRQFTCTATIDGKEHKVNITVRNEENAEYEVATPVAK